MVKIKRKKTVSKKILTDTFPDPVADTIAKMQKRVESKTAHPPRSRKRGKKSKMQIISSSGNVFAVNTEAVELLKEKGLINMPTAAPGRKIVKKPAALRHSILTQATERPESKMTSLEKMELAGNGISKKDLEELKNKAGLNYNQLAEILSVSRAALINKKGNARFNQDVSEKIVEIAAIYSYGYEVFEDKERFNNWISTLNRALGYKAPYELLSSSFGREEVKAVIGRIDYGVYS